MGKSLRLKVILSTLFIFLIVMINEKAGIVFLPSKEVLPGHQVDIITISTIFAGFSFTTMGLFVGFSSEELIKKVENTNIMYKKVERVLTSIVFFLLSCFTSLSFVLNMSFLPETIKNGFHEVAYFLGIGYLIVGIIYFSCAVKELTQLLRLIYHYNQKSTMDLQKVTEELARAKEKLKGVEYED